MVASIDNFWSYDSGLGHIYCHMDCNPTLPATWALPLLGRHKHRVTGSIGLIITGRGGRLHAEVCIDTVCS